MKKIEKINNRIDELKKEILKLNEELTNIKSFESIAIFKTTTILKDFSEFEKNVKETIDINIFENLGEKKLAYKIKQQNEGCYIKIEFEGTEKDVEELEKIYKSNKNIIKFITIRCEDY